MKKSLVLSLLSISLWMLSLPSQAEHKLTQVWKTDNLAVPESVLYVKGDEPYLLVSLIDGGSATVDHKGGIAKLDPEGHILDGKWFEGLDAPKGMGIFGENLYVADITQIVVINIKHRKLVKKIPVPGAVFLNDITVNWAGKVFVSDTRTGKIYLLDDDEVSLYLDKVPEANGLDVIGSNLVVGSATNLMLYSPDKQGLVMAKGFGQNLDGIVMVDRGVFVVSCWPGLIYYVAADGKTQLLLDSQAQKINTADLGYDPVNRHVLVPNFLKNSVTAYRLD